MTDQETFTLGVQATVVMDHETHGPRCIDYQDRGLRQVVITDDEGNDESGALVLVEEIPIVSTYSLHVALYALQNPTEENIARALYKIGISGDVDEHVDSGTLYPLGVPEPPGWADRVPGDPLG